MRRHLVTAFALLATVAFAAPSAHAVVVDMNALGQPSVNYNSSDQTGYVGAALVPGTCGDLLGSGSCASLVAKGVPTVKSSGPCTDPALTSDLWLFGQTDRLPDRGLCSHGGAVLHKNETFALTWDTPQPNQTQHNYFEGTRLYIEQFLRDVADASGTLANPYADTSQYVDGSGRAQNSSRYGGGCIDYGSVGGSQCEFGSPTGPGHDYGANGCTPSGASFISGKATVANDVCVTDSQLQGEVSTMVNQTGIVGRTQPGYSPEVVLLTPPGVETCLDATAKLCSVNANISPPPPVVTPNTTGGTLTSATYQVELTYVTAGGESLPGAAGSVSTTGTTSSITINSPPAANGATGWYAYVTGPDGATYFRQQASATPIGGAITVTAPPSSGASPPHPPYFCSYHSQVNVGGTEVEYVVQPWTGQTACDEPDVSLIPDPVPVDVLAKDFGIRLVSPLSQSHVASIVDPAFNSWFALDGAEINDNGGCTPLPNGLDNVTVGSSSQSPYLLQREFNNAGAIEIDPATYFGCVPQVDLRPSFVVPSGVNQGDQVEFDGSTTDSTLIVPNAGYQWDFGDGSTATGPSVVHSYAKGGTYTVKLTVTDRGGNAQTLSQSIVVLGPDGNPVPPPSTTPGSPPGGGQPGGGQPGGGQGQSGGSPGPSVLQAHLTLLPQGLKSVLRHGVSLRLTSNEAADGFASITITNARARRLGMKGGQHGYVVVGQGTLSGVKSGTAGLHLRLPHKIVGKLERLHHLTLTIRLVLMAQGGSHTTLVEAGRY